MKNLGNTLDEIERLARTNHAEEIAEDPKKFRRALLRGIMGRFPLRKGRRKEAHLDQAERLRRRGATWNTIAALVNPEYPLWDEYRRQRYRHALESGIRRRKRREEMVQESKAFSFGSAVQGGYADPKLAVERRVEDASTNQPDPGTTQRSA